MYITLHSNDFSFLFSNFKRPINLFSLPGNDSQKKKGFSNYFNPLYVVYISYSAMNRIFICFSTGRKVTRGFSSQGRRSFVIHRKNYISFAYILKVYQARCITFEVIWLIFFPTNSWNWIQSIITDISQGLSRKIVDRKYWAHLYYFSYLTGDSRISLFLSTFELVELERRIWQLNFLGVIQTFSVIKKEMNAAHTLWTFLKSGADFCSKKTAYILQGFRPFIRNCVTLSFSFLIIHTLSLLEFERHERRRVS